MCGIKPGGAFSASVAFSASGNRPGGGKMMLAQLAQTLMQAMQGGIVGGLGCAGGGPFGMGGGPCACPCNRPNFGSGNSAYAAGVQQGQFAAGFQAGQAAASGQAGGGGGMFGDFRSNMGGFLGGSNVNTGFGGARAFSTGGGGAFAAAVAG